MHDTLTSYYPVSVAGNISVYPPQPQRKHFTVHSFQNIVRRTLQILNGINSNVNLKIIKIHRVQKWRRDGKHGEFRRTLFFFSKL
jgi:hypothetical protein